jgi:hypothetical protein
MPQLNLPGSGHVAPAAVAGWQWLPIPEANYKNRIQHAMHIITGRIQACSPCNAAFRALPGGRTFAQVWADPAVWIKLRSGERRGPVRSNASQGDYSVTVRVQDWSVDPGRDLDSRIGARQWCEWSHPRCGGDASEMPHGPTPRPDHHGPDPFGVEADPYRLDLRAEDFGWRVFRYE